jgi:hypothetical protein
MVVRRFVFAIAMVPLVSGCVGCPRFDEVPRLSAEAIQRIADRKAAEEGIKTSSLSPPVVSFHPTVCLWWAWYSLNGPDYPKGQTFGVSVNDMTGSVNSLWARVVP